MRVHIAPYYTGADKIDGGIRRVVEAQQKYLPALGWDVVSNPDEADLIACHGATLVERPGVPMVAHCHGMMWEDYFPHYADDINRHVIEVMTRAQAITAPSQWVAHAITRGMLVKPEVIYHGVDADEWQTDEPPLDYVLWNKARTDPVSDPADMQQLAALLPDVRFVTTFGQPTQNVMVIGPMDAPSMRPVVQRAGLYLCTARETMGIGTLEALAAGVPVVGWDYGGQHEIVRQGDTGYLAPFGDFDELAACIRRALAERDRLSANARADARERWGWRDKVRAYADLYTRVVTDWTAPRPKVSVVVTAYNLAQYLPEALASVAEQTMQDWELFVVDDCSTDDSLNTALMWRADYLQSTAHIATQDRVTVHRTPHNLGLSGARNYGWQHATGRYILFLDADDLLAPNALDTLSTALDQRPDVHIAYGSLDTMSHDGSNRKRNPWPGGAFDWHAQIAHLNQLTYCSLMRREVLERSGGYRTRDWRAEDAAFWTRVTSFGFRAAKVTEDSILIYRMHDAQKSRGEPGDGDWTAWLPWRLASSPQDGLRAIESGAQPNTRIVPFGAQGTPPAPRRAWPVRHHQHPVVSVVIPVGPGHQELLIDALDSVQAQTFVEWECIVVNNTDSPLNVAGSPWARVIDEIASGAGSARNAGLRAVQAPFVVFLDADDVLHPRFLEETLKAYQGSYVYTDWATLDDPHRIDGEVKTFDVEDYNQRAMLQGLRHAVTTLLPTEWARDVGGFDEQLPVFEDWDFYNKLAVAGHCGQRLAQPLLIYRGQHGLRTRKAITKVVDGVAHYTPLGEQVAQALADRYHAWRSGEESVMACGGCGGQAVVAEALNDMVSFATNGVAPAAPVELPEGTTVRMEFIGGQEGAQTFIGIGSRLQYRAGREQGARFHDVDPRDVQRFLDLGLFRIVEPIANTVDEPPIAVVEPRAERPKPKGRRVN